MQAAFDFAEGDLEFIQRSLARHFGPLEPVERRVPLWQLVRSLIGAQTYDDVAEAALTRLMWRWPDPAGLADADPRTVLRYIDDVTHAKGKAEHLVAAMQRIGRERRRFDLSFLREMPVRDALDWLERLPGVGPKVAAATLNFSTLEMPVFVVDSHVHRILLRFGLIGPQASAEQGRDAVTAGGFGAEAMADLFARMKLLGQKICRPFSPACGMCPLAARCQRRTALGRPAAAARRFQPFKSRRNPPRVPPFPGGPRLSG